MISTWDLTCLPDIPKLRALMQSLALLDSILADKWEYRYYSFNSRWNGESELGSMRNGSGDEYFAMFYKFGAIIKGFTHESIMSPYGKSPPSVWPGVLDAVPKIFSPFLEEPAISINDTTFCIWRLIEDAQWRCGEIKFPKGKDPDGSEDLLSLLDGKSETYKKWAESYYEHKPSIEAVDLIYTHAPVTKALVDELNNEAALQRVLDDAKEIGYC
jgi:hypothetical protein